MRKLLKKYFLPIKWRLQEIKRYKNIHLVSVETIKEERKKKEKEYHEYIRKNYHKEAEITKGFIQALDWVCQELNEYKT